MARPAKIRWWIWFLVGAALLVLVAASGVWLIARRNKRPAPPPVASTQAPAAYEVAESIYDGGLKQGWDDRSWTRRELKAGQPAKVAFVSFGGLALHHEELTPNYGALVFRYKAPEDFGDFLDVSLSLSGQQSSFPKLSIDEEDARDLADGWKEVLLPLSSLNPSASHFDGILVQARRMVGDDFVLIDRIALTKPGAEATSKLEAPSKRSFVTLDCRASTKPISPLIYGIAQGTQGAGETAHRIGGNAMTRLNWDVGNIWNTGSDWFFENVKGSDAGLPAWLSDAQAHDIKMALTVPTIGWVAKDATSSGFPRGKFAAQRKYDEHRPEAGDGFDLNGKPLKPLDPEQTSEEASPERIQKWVEAIRARDRQSGKRSIEIYMLDNEPDLWHTTHRDVHPEPLTYDELLDRTLRYGAAVRKADPEAIIAGPASWGWTGYFFSAKDSVAGAMLQPDRRAHGGAPLIPWFLQELAMHEQKTGERVLDVLDVHYYPQGEKVYSPAADPATAALRLRSTRSLWDPTYVDESWIKDTVRLLPRLKEWVDKFYPGRRISLGEWSFGAEQDMSGGLATAEALGRFGQQGLYAAFYWNKPEPSTTTYWAFRAYRNYDGKGARFQDVSVSANSSKPVSVFASRDESGSRFVLVLLNLEQSYNIDLDFDVSSCGGLTVDRVFRYTGGKTGITAEPKPSPALNDLKLPPYSISVIELSHH